MIQGFTHLGATGVTWPADAPFPTMPELEELKASAVAVPLTVAPVRPHIRAKNVGRSVRCTFTVTRGFTPNGRLGPEAAHCVSELLGNVTATWAGRRAIPPIVFCVATAFATEVASAHACCHGLIAPAALLDGSPVIPLIERTRAAARAAVSAERCASALAR